MKNWILALMLLFVATPCLGQRIVDLPETGQKWFLTAVYSDASAPTQQDRRLAAILRGDLSHLVSQVNFVEWDASTEFVNQSDWKAYLGTNRPALILQTPADSDGKGRVVYFASGPHLKTDQYLVQSIAAAVDRFKANGADCPRCPVRPQPVQPPVQPPVRPIPTIVPDIDVVVNPRPKTPEKSVPLWALLLPVIGAGLAVRKLLLEDLEPDDEEVV
jgi:hypothetical protein